MQRDGSHTKGFRVSARDCVVVARCLIRSTLLPLKVSARDCEVVARSSQGEASALPAADAFLAALDNS